MKPRRVFIFFFFPKWSYPHLVAYRYLPPQKPKTMLHVCTADCTKLLPKRRKKTSASLSDSKEELTGHGCETSFPGHHRQPTHSQKARAGPGTPLTAELGSRGTQLPSTRQLQHHCSDRLRAVQLPPHHPNRM